MVVDKGKNVVFNIKASGYPVPKENWTRNGRSIDLNELLPDGRPKYIIANHEERYIFEIKKVDTEDSDEYIFKFKNEYGEAATYSRLLVME